MEAIERIKTVHHLNCQDIFIERFEAATLRQLNTDIKVLLIQVCHFKSRNRSLGPNLCLDQWFTSSYHSCFVYYWIFYDPRTICQGTFDYSSVSKSVLTSIL